MHYCSIKHTFMENEIESDLLRKIVILEKMWKKAEKAYGIMTKRMVISKVK